MPPRRSVRVLLVVDGFFSLGPQDSNDRSFSISYLIPVLKSSPNIILDTAHRDGDHSATIWGTFNFANTVADLSFYDEIWLFGYNGPNKADKSNVDFHKPLDEDELLTLARFMQDGGGVLASGDHDGLGCYMCGRIPRVRTMRKWFADGDDSDYAKESLPASAPRNWPVQGVKRADTLQKDIGGNFHFTNQSDDIPQPLNLLPVSGGKRAYHALFEIGVDKALRQVPDHMHDRETLGFGGVEESEPWSLDETLTFKGEKSTEYPTLNDHQEKPTIIATGTVIGDHDTKVEPNKLCESGFRPDNNKTEAKEINTLSAYDGHKVGVGRVLTDSSFHHFLDLNFIGDPCAAEEKTRGFQPAFLGEMAAFYRNCVLWLANPRLYPNGERQTEDISV